MTVRRPRTRMRVCCALCLIVARQAHALAALLPAVLPASSAAVGHRLEPQEPGYVSFRNTSWDVVRLEIRRGKAASCDQGALAGTISLKRGRSWTVRSNEPICWRRETQPGQAHTGWSAWHREVPTASPTSARVLP